MQTAPISLYIAIEDKRSAELEVVARAALEFAAGLREIAFIYDPSFEFRLELERGDEGSLWLKAFIRWIRGMGYPRPTMTGVALAAGLWFGGHVGDKLFDEGWEHIFGEDGKVELSQAQLQEVADRAAKAATAESAGQHFRNVYRELERDPVVAGVGVTPSHNRRPSIIVPRSEFGLRSSAPAIIAAPGDRRTTVERGDYVIIRPVLKEGGGRWRLSGHQGEFSATIADQTFYDAVLSGTAPVPLAAEIHISADLETTSERTPEGAWKPIAHRILKVYGIERQPRQQRFLGPSD